MANVVFGLLGVTLDQGKSEARWAKWRPTVALCQHDDFVVDRLELLYQPKFAAMVDLVAKDIAQISPETEIRKHPVAIADPWDLGEVYSALFDFARAYEFAPDDNDYFIHITTGTHIAQISMFLLAESRHLPAKLLQTSPPTRAQPEPAGSFSIIDLNLARYDKIAARFQSEQRDARVFLKQGIATKNDAFNRLIEGIEEVALKSTEPMLLLGATGSGKSQLAKRIYELKKMREQLRGEFVEINCATLRGDSAMSTLFGHAKGAFTGAISERAGLLKRAHKGVLFLDEIGELGADEQAMLLRAIEEKVYFPFGADKTVGSDFQLIAGTHRDLHEEVQRGRFREDLLARIQLWTFRLPSLRERLEDLPPNLDYELEKAGRVQGIHFTMSKEARILFLRFATGTDARWSGNFRDLNGAVKRMTTLSEGGRIREEDVFAEIERLRFQWGKSTETARAKTSLPSGIDPFDAVQLEYVLGVCRASRSLSEAGRTLFAHSRTQKAQPNDADRLRKYLLRFGLSWSEVASDTNAYEVQ